MEDYWNSQNPSIFSMQYQSGEMPTQEPRMGFEFPPTSVPPAEADRNLNPPESYQTLDLDSTLSFNGTISPSLSASDSLSALDSLSASDSLSTSDSGSTSDSQDSQGSVTYTGDAESQKLQTVRRRMQNREAQRRFRGRKEERYQILQQRTTELEEKCQELSNGFNQKSEELSKISKENETLISEIQDLRKRWRLILMLLRRPNRLQSLSGLLGSDLSSPSAVMAEPLDLPLEDLFGCLQELLLPNETHTAA
ncbi:bZIP transcription factor bZIP-1 [Penicillium cataractarum]|uniref:BZIP transcription factor bZIP-1 n=1 Tax=Penicillium cataractarum TaxID=2100454 RepID=A0A9W9SLM4_9EURO|nr:bZIP transcription factor bZIP-1 [Penicillium cataractarum]KAJ5380767.1 bZIP transcription factor bZIP-1 [Penicillium cataractarum]